MVGLRYVNCSQILINDVRLLFLNVVQDVDFLLVMSSPEMSKQSALLVGSRPTGRTLIDSPVMESLFVVVEILPGEALVVTNVTPVETMPGGLILVSSDESHEISPGLKFRHPLTFCLHCQILF